MVPWLICTLLMNDCILQTGSLERTISSQILNLNVFFMIATQFLHKTKPSSAGLVTAPAQFAPCISTKQLTKCCLMFQHKRLSVIGDLRVGPTALFVTWKSRDFTSSYHLFHFVIQTRRLAIFATYTAMTLTPFCYPTGVLSRRVVKRCFFDYWLVWIVHEQHIFILFSRLHYILSCASVHKKPWQLALTKKVVKDREFE